MFGELVSPSDTVCYGKMTNFYYVLPTQQKPFLETLEGSLDGFIENGLQTEGN